MTQADSPSSPALASLPTVLHGSTSDSDEPATDVDNGTRPEPESPDPTRSSPSSEAPPTPSPTPTSPPPPPSGPASTTSPSSTASTSERPDPGAVGISAGVGAVGGEVVDAMALPLVQALGVLVNRTYTRRTGDYSPRWLFTADESEALAGALGRITARRLPEQLVEGEGGDVFLIIGVTGGYLVRNAIGITEAQMAAAAASRDEGPGPAPASPPPPAPPRADAPADDEQPRGAHVHVLSAQEVGAV